VEPSAIATDRISALPSLAVKSRRTLDYRLISLSRFDEPSRFIAGWLKPQAVASSRGVPLSSSSVSGLLSPDSVQLSDSALLILQTIPEFGEKMVNWRRRRRRCGNSTTAAGSWVHFSRFLPRDAMHSADVPSQDVFCPSVRLSHASILSERLRISSNFCHRRVATQFNFHVPNANGVAIFRRGPLERGRRMQVVWKIAIFDQYLALSRKYFKIEP